MPSPSSSAAPWRHDRQGSFVISAIERFFRERLQANDADEGGLAVDALPLACAALMFEVVRADQSVEESERARLRELLRSEFELETADLDAVEALGNL